MLGKMKYLDIPKGRMVLAVSDGELNNADKDGRGSDQSLNSLPSVQTTGLTSEHSVASWAVSFERLLQDPLGVDYFTEFLKKEYSAENIFFWKSCEKFQSIPAGNTDQLLKESRSIYNEFLSSKSLCPVNVDHQALITEEMLQKPFPDMFKSHQTQIFNLMKFDSYTRFVKSSLYQECMLSEVEGRPLPSLGSSPDAISTDGNNLTSGAVKKKLRPGKSLPLGVEVTGVENIADLVSKSTRRSFKKKDRRGTCRESLESNGFSSRRESQTSFNSTTSLDQSLTSNASKSENDDGSLSNAEPEAEAKPVKYCCVYLPDGTASLTAVKPGLTIRDMLAGVCEKRGYYPTDVKVYLAGNEQKALALDQECKVLTDQEVRLENRIHFDLQIECLNKNVRIVSKSTKTIQEAIQPTMKKYGLENQHVVLHKVGDSQVLDQRCSVNEVAGQMLMLDVTDIKEAPNRTGNAVNHQTKKDSIKEKIRETNIPVPRRQTNHINHIPGDSGKVKNKPHHQAYDIEGLVELLNRVQSSRAEDQRGLLSKKDLELPEFLKLPTVNRHDSCDMTGLNDSIESPEVPSCSLDVSLSPEICSEHKPCTDTRSSSPESFTSSQKQITSNTAALKDGVRINRDTIHKEIISELNSMHQPPSANNQIQTESFDSPL
ncbi:regulator of G-protein signaling 14 isoform X2 [Spea bombifrons]|uniref:regulator of G-protein signaling 14 isoform X2 n=1 Tax=Spea bombifrons TaxID=233779 RepID=UPI00234996F7|nr:regulator of G-protein signaling 14 isoform X2 [Spea bombifrons]